MHSILENSFPLLLLSDHALAFQLLNSQRKHEIMRATLHNGLVLSHVRLD
jgi:hypothetical protein